MPLAITLTHKLTKKLAEVRKNGELPYLLPDGKAQVTIEYRNNKARRVESIVISTQHREDIGLSKITKDINEKIINPIIPYNI